MSSRRCFSDADHRGHGGRPPDSQAGSVDDGERRLVVPEVVPQGQEVDSRRLPPGTSASRGGTASPHASPKHEGGNRADLPQQAASSAPEEEGATSAA